MYKYKDKKMTMEIEGSNAEVLRSEGRIRRGRSDRRINKGLERGKKLRWNTGFPSLYL